MAKTKTKRAKTAATQRQRPLEENFTKTRMTIDSKSDEKPADVEDLSPDTLLISIFAMLIATAWAAVFDSLFTTISERVSTGNPWSDEQMADMGLRVLYAVFLTTFGVYFIRTAVVKYRIKRNKKNEIVDVAAETVS